MAKPLEFTANYVWELWVLRGKPKTLEFSTPFGLLTQVELLQLEVDGLLVELVETTARGSRYKLSTIDGVAV